MYSVLIVDDEYLIRVGISSKIKFFEFPYDNIYFAENGCEALSIVENHPVDIMMVDIRMPGMDGLALIRKVKDLRKNIHFIVISGYADFEYARDALQSGVEAYLLKPIDDDQLMDTLNQLREKIDLQFKNQLQASEMELNSQALSIEREMNLLLHAMSEKMPQNRRNGLNAYPQFGTGYFQLMMIRVENRTVDDENKPAMVKKQIIRLIGDKEDRHEDCLVIDDYMRLNNVLVIVHNASHERVTAAVNDVSRTLADLYLDDKGIVFGISALHDTIGKPLYSEALWACDLRLLYKDRTQFAYKAELGVKPQQNDYYEDFKDLLEKKELQLFEARLREMLDPDRIIATMHGNIRNVVRVLLSLVSQKSDSNHVIQRASVDECIENATNVEDIITFIYNLSESIFFKDLVISTNCKDIIEKLEKHILIHYKKRLVLRELAIMYNMNSNYMSSIFKKILGKGFSDYLTQVRLKHACDMLLNTKMSINEIAQESGFENSSYFYRVFKNSFGITALQYRNHADRLGSS